MTADALGRDHHRRRDRPVDVRAVAAVRGSRVRPPLVRLLGGRGPRLEGGPPGLARAPRGRLPEPDRGPPPANPFLADLEERGRQPVRVGGLGGGARSTRSCPTTTTRVATTRSRRAGRTGRRSADTAPRKLRLLGRGLGVVGSYAKVLLADDVPAAYCQFGPLTAYPRAQRTRDLYPALPDAPLPAVITCIATTAAARGAGLARPLVEDVCDDLAARGFAAVETYPEIGARPDATSAATPDFWESVGFVVAAPDERFPVLRRELA